MSTSEPIKVRRAKPGDVAEIAAIHVRSWQAAYRGILPDDLLAGLSVKEREQSWRRLLSGNEHHWLNLIAEGGRGPLGFCAVTTPSWDASASERLAEVGALYVDAWSEVVLWVLPENRRALDFYARFGFRVEEGVEKREERSGRPVIRLRAPVGR